MLHGAPNTDTDVETLPGGRKKAQEAKDGDPSKAGNQHLTRFLIISADF